MKELNYYKERGLLSTNDVFQYLKKTFVHTNRTWDFYVDWKKVFSNYKKYKIEFNILNSLCDSKNFDKDLEELLIKYPEITEVFQHL